MHELSLAQSIVEMAEVEARRHHAAVIEELELEIGLLAGVDVETLDFALESAVKGSWLENARIVRHVLTGEARCGECQTVFSLHTPLVPCPQCGSWWIEILRGKELRIKSIVVR